MGIWRTTHRPAELPGLPGPRPRVLLARTTPGASHGVLPCLMTYSSSSSSGAFCASRLRHRNCGGTVFHKRRRFWNCARAASERPEQAGGTELRVRDGTQVRQVMGWCEGVTLFFVSDEIVDGGCCIVLGGETAGVKHR